MKKHFFAVLALSFSLLTGVAAADRLAIAEPVVSGGVSAEEVAPLWGMLEGTVDGGFDLVSRAAITQMMTEIGLTTSSDLLNLNDVQKARLGEIKTVKYLLVTTVGKFGGRLSIAMVVLDSSTGQIDARRKVSTTVVSLDELADKLPDMLNEMGLGGEVKKRGRSAILTPVIKVNDAPGYLGEDFNVRLEEHLLENGVKLHNLQSVGKILKRNKIDNLYEAEPAMFVRIGGLLRVDCLIQATINRFSCVTTRDYSEITRQDNVRMVGNIEGNIRIISAQTGEVEGSIPFRHRVNFSSIKNKRDWQGEDFGKHLIEGAIAEVAKKVVPKVK